MGLILFAWVASAGVTYFYSNRVLLQQVDRQLEQYANIVSYMTGVFARQLEEGQPLYESWSGHDYDLAHLEPIVIDIPVSEGLPTAVNIWENGNLIAILADSPSFSPPTQIGIMSLDTDGGASHWRVLSFFSEADDVWIRVGIELGAARKAMLQTLGRSLLPLLIILPLTVLVLYLGVSRGLQPLHELAQQISRRNSSLLDPVDTEAVPAEVAGVVGSLNDLLRRLAAALEGEQRFTANAAHELMTPLAAIKTEVQLCQRLMRAGEGGEEMLGRVVLRVDRASHTVEQLLTLARLDPDLPLVSEPVALRPLLSSVLAESGHLAADRSLQVALEDGPACTVAGSEEALAILLRNLVNNAFRYATEGSVVELQMSQEKGVTLSICNDCEPLSANEFGQITERFYRVPGSTGVGTGLGLSIVSRIVEMHQAEFTARPGGGGRGFCVEVRFPQLA
jgi:two-component system, OmpR family, sensor kinase